MSVALHARCSVDANVFSFVLCGRRGDNGRSVLSLVAADEELVTENVALVKLVWPVVWAEMWKQHLAM